MNNSPLQQALLNLNPPPLEGEVVPFSAQKMVITQQEYIDLKWRASYWESQHTRLIVREEQLKEELKQKEAIIRDLKQRLYGTASEKSGNKADFNPNDKNKKTTRSRGQQKGSVTHGRTQRPNLPVIPEVISLSELTCGTCGLDYSLLSSYEESDIIEIEVAAHIRKIKRQKCVKNCTCTSGKIITAAIPPKLIPRSPYGNSIWEEMLLSKFLYAQPVNRTLNDFKSLGLKISPGTIAGGLKKLTPLFKPVYKAFHHQQMTENRFHNDETRWEVYNEITRSRVD
jgi:transposase